MTKLAAGETRNTAAPTMSAGMPQRPADVRRRTQASNRRGRERRIHRVGRKPGAMPFTWISKGATSTARARVIIRSAPLLAAYATMFGRPIKLASEQMLRILPRRRDFMPGSTARAR